jgi:hypothetical protein
MTEGRSGLILHYGSQRLEGKGSRPILKRLPQLQAIKPDFHSIVIGNDTQEKSVELFTRLLHYGANE